MWFIGVEVEEETSAPPPKKNPGSAPECDSVFVVIFFKTNYNLKKKMIGFGCCNKRSNQGVENWY